MRLFLLGALAFAACSPASRPDLSAPAAGPRNTTTTRAAGGDYVEIRADPSSRTEIIAAPVEQVWSAVITTLQQMEFPVTTIDTDRHTIGNLNHAVRGKLIGKLVSRSVDCGRGRVGTNMANSARVTVAFLATLTSTSAGATEITANFRGTAIDPGVNNANPVACSSTGYLEQQFFDAVQAQIRS